MSDQSAAKARGGVLKLALWSVAAVGVAAVIYIIAQASIKPGQASGLRPLARGEMSKLTFPVEATAAPAASFTGPDGRALRVADFKGKVVVLNLWATWCGPCVTEMPTLAKLQAEYAGKPLAVVAVSMDGAQDLDKARAFIVEHAPLTFYNDPKLKLPFALVPPSPGMPTTVIYGADGVERARLSGGADWSGADAKAVLDLVLAES
jgi:thiol-disulfide isomerase/thioredoxin